jgi:small subunit ribosomal protein S8
MHDPISDLLTRLRNAGAAGHPAVTLPHSKLKESVARILQSEGYVVGYKATAGKRKELVIELKYTGRRPVIAGLKQVSTPGLRRYVGCDEIPRVLGGLGICVLSTSRGVLSGKEASKSGVGGELICTVW